jgi:hypothetical protein
MHEQMQKMMGMDMSDDHGGEHSHHH